MGLEQTRSLATLFDGITRHNPEGLWFRRYAQKHRFKAAIAWRDSGRPIPERDEARKLISEIEGSDQHGPMNYVTSKALSRVPELMGNEEGAPEEAWALAVELLQPASRFAPPARRERADPGSPATARWPWPDRGWPAPGWTSDPEARPEARQRHVQSFRSVARDLAPFPRACPVQAWPPPSQTMDRLTGVQPVPVMVKRMAVRQGPSPRHQARSMRPSLSPTRRSKPPSVG